MKNLGSAEITIKLSNNTITVRRGTDSSILHKAEVKDENIWDNIWEAIREN
jgi:hypothetical protein|tara:strand:- start:2361 stop:2513 length:153 start_codon:yes stop_codon:yes gene_type:complete